MSFYESFAIYYDDLFPAGKDKLSFLNQYISKPSQILDIGCATGAISLNLAQSGHTVTGIDLDEGLIEIAFKKVENDSIEFKQMNMLDVSRLNFS